MLPNIAEFIDSLSFKKTSGAKSAFSYPLSLLAALVFLVILPNIVQLSVAGFLGIGRPLVNFDYLIVVLFLQLGFVRTALALFLAVYALDAVSLVGQIFPFLRFADLLYLTKFIDLAPVPYVGVVLGVVLWGVVLFYAVLSFVARSGRAANLLVINVFVFLYLFTMENGDGANKYWRIDDSRKITSISLYLFDSRTASFVDQFSIAGNPLKQAEYDGAFHDKLSDAIGKENKILLVLAESWGVPLNKAIQRKITAPLANSSAVSDIETGQIEFSGATVNGELRELCGLQASHYNLKPVKEGFDSCLPNIFRTHGYETASIHGAVGAMYDRYYWYPRVGFDRSIFFESKDWGDRCYSFPGACDLELIGEVEEVISEDKKLFVYWLTLNSHAVYDERDIRVDVFDCTEFGVEPDSQSCRNFKLQSQFFYYLSAAIDSGSLDGVTVFVVGDHSPPIMNMNEKLKYFAEKRVPWLSFHISAAGLGPGSLQMVYER